MLAKEQHKTNSTANSFYCDNTSQDVLSPEFLRKSPISESVTSAFGDAQPPREAGAWENHSVIPPSGGITRKRRKKRKAKQDDAVPYRQRSFRLAARVNTAQTLMSQYWAANQSINLKGSSVVGCGRWSAGRDNAGKACIELRDGQARMHGHFQCGCVWTCEQCGTKKAASLRSWMVEEMFPSMEKLQLGSSMLTLTLRHRFTEDWSDIRDRLREAWTLLDRRLAKFYKKYGCIGKVKAAEATIGANGLHFHFHILLTHYKPWPAKCIRKDENEKPIWEEFHLVPRQPSDWLRIDGWPKNKNGTMQHLVPRECHGEDRWIPRAEFDVMATKLSENWAEAVKEVGGSVNQYGSDFSPNRSDTYLAKIETLYEMASSNSKKGKGLTLGQLLDEARGKGELARESGALWLRAIEALQSTARFETGGLHKKLGVLSPTAWDKERMRAEKAQRLEEDQKHQDFLDTATPEELATFEILNGVVNKNVPVYIEYSLDDHIKATHPKLNRIGGAMILRAAVRSGEPGVKRMVAALCAEYDKIMQPKWMNSSGITGAGAEPWGDEPAIIKTARQRPLSKDEVHEYIRVKNGYSHNDDLTTSRHEDFIFDSVPLAADAACPF